MKRFKKEFETQTDWNRIRTGFYGGVVGWLLSIPVLTPIFLILRTEGNEWRNRLIQLLMTVGVVLFCRLGFRIGVSRYDKSINEKRDGDASVPNR